MMELWKKLSDREKKLLVSFVLILAIYLAYNSIISKSLDRLEQANLALEEMEQKEQELQIEMAQFQGLKKRYGDYKIDELLVKLPQRGEISEVILWIEELFDDSGLSSPNIQFNVASDEPSYVQVGLSFTGSYDSVHNVLGKIENNEQLTMVESANLSGSRDMKSASVTLRIYAQSYN